MKKKILFFISILLVIAIVIVGVFFIKKGETDSSNITDNKENEVQKTVTELLSIEEVEKFAKENKIEYNMGLDKSGATLCNASLLDEHYNITYFFDGNGKSTELSINSILNATVDENDFILEITDITADSLSQKVWKIIYSLCDMLNCTLTTNLYLSNDDGTFTAIETEQDFQRIIDGTAFLSFSVRDKDGMYWVLRVSSNDSLISMQINKYFDKNQYIDYFANISLYEEEE